MPGHHLVRASDVPRTEAGSAVLEGASYNTPVSFFAVDSDRPGMGPSLHSHPYAEVFLVRAGRALATAGDEEIELAAGDVLFVEAQTPHGFRNLGPERLEIVTIHAAGRMETTWL
jgi:mannose-6-phosphate isomerase-like protein (cupin superfamily)